MTVLRILGAATVLLWVAALMRWSGGGQGTGLSLSTCVALLLALSVAICLVATWSLRPSVQLPAGARRARAKAAISWQHMAGLSALANGVVLGSGFAGLGIAIAIFGTAELLAWKRVGQ